jgi:putative transposase
VELARAYEKLGDSRLDFLHKASCNLVSQCSLISLEDLSIMVMVQERFGEQINDAGWGMLASMLCYKAESANCKVVFVNPEGTTHECSRCGRVVAKMLAARVHSCWVAVWLLTVT